MATGFTFGADIGTPETWVTKTNDELKQLWRTHARSLQILRRKSKAELDRFAEFLDFAQSVSDDDGYFWEEAADDLDVAYTIVYHSGAATNPYDGVDEALTAGTSTQALKNMLDDEISEYRDAINEKMGDRRFTIQEIRRFQAVLRTLENARREVTAGSTFNALELSRDFQATFPSN
jgi:hypothetical protein